MFKLDLYLTPHTKINPSRISDLNINDEIIQAPRKKVLILKEKDTFPSRTPNPETIKDGYIRLHKVVYFT